MSISRACSRVIGLPPRSRNVVRGLSLATSETLEHDTFGGVLQGLGEAEFAAVVGFPGLGQQALLFLDAELVKASIEQRVLAEVAAPAADRVADSTTGE